MKTTTKKCIFVLGLSLGSLALTVTNLGAVPLMEKIHDSFTEDFGGVKPGFRYKVRNVKIDGMDNIARIPGGQQVPVSMDILHDCPSCGNAINQIIVGLSGQAIAQASVWNGKQRSGGPLMVVNPGTKMVAYAEDNPGPAAWVKVYFTITVPKKPGIYYLRSRYAQDYIGRLMTISAKGKPQPDDSQARKWWRVDRPHGPGSAANIGAFIVE